MKRDRARETEYGWFWAGRCRRPWLRRHLLQPQRVAGWGEWLALRHLRRLGWDILARNWTLTWGEADLIAYHRETLVLVEVKTLLSPAPHVRPEDHFDEDKLKRLESLALDFIRRKELGSIPLRFDLVAVETPDLRKFELRHYIL